MEYVVAAVILLVVLIVGAVGLVVPKMRRRELPPQSGGSTTTLERPPTAPPVPAEEELPPLIERVEAPVVEAPVVEPPVVEEPVVEAPVVETPEPTAGRLVRLRARLARSQTALGRGLLAVLSRDHLEEDDWEEIEDSLITADVGVEATQVIVERLRERVRILGSRTVAEVREQLAEELTAALEPELDRSLRTAPHDGRPAVLMVVGVNGAGKTTTCGKIGRVLIADGRSVLFGAADTFRAAATEQLATWGERVGAETVRGPEGGDPASVAFDAVKRGIETGVDTVVVDTAGRLQNKVGLMDELGKVKRVVEKHGPVDETLLVLDATTGQNGLEQARVFTEVVDVTGVVLTKLDGTAKGGIVIAVQRKLGIPVKLVGLGEGPDDLAPFEPAAFVEALLGETA
ncbi:signal recognition particle-docking protein FtsY [Actinoplanes teichomyceticus]|uniref:Signal recognition particle receptor FtsY n=1 Tax=Actinoplanes teichomyceticus TaxID=1867 RepID=A0A561WNL1_ACTTI|nr:signal recognition particle-docking protein FtsY [Actinoplanes teichomyceticus]TWG25413.1 signal recognition particle-docking protein FtsY [Actinoplanes teichomyceticus]GIF10480.1 signal recognition particle receptor FtsY [Actinoplanes teichomyceticus]